MTDSSTAPEPSTPGPETKVRGGAWGAAALYACLVVVLMADLGTDPRRSLLANDALQGTTRNLARLDQQMVVSVVAKNAERLASAPWQILSDGHCFPFPHAFTMGEHMIGTGLLAALPFAATGEPILAYNAALALTFWLPGMTMFFLARRFTGQVGAALVSGAFFAMQPLRVIDAGHPFVHADFWIPLVLLFLSHCYARWHATALPGLAMVACLQALESIYPLVGCLILCVLYGITLVLRRPTALPGALTRIALAAVPVAGLGWFLFGPYLETSQTWGLLQGRGGTHLPASAVLPGGIAFPGVPLLLLAGAGLVAGRPRPETAAEDPRGAMAVGAILLLWGTVQPLALPGLGGPIPNPIDVICDLIPGLDAVRAGFAVGYTVGVPLALLAGYGFAALSRAASPRTRAVIAAVALGALALERFEPRVAEASFGSALRLRAWPARPYQEDIDLIRSVGRGPSIDVPHPSGDDPIKLVSQSDYLLLRAFAPAPIAACYNSFPSPLQRELAQIAGGLPDAAAANELAALGFETVILHPDRLLPMAVRRFDRILDEDTEARASLEPRGRTPRLHVHRLRAATGVLRDFQALGPAAPPTTSTGRAGLDGTIAFEIRNLGTDTYAHPAPIAPTDVWVVWEGEGHVEPVLRTAARVVLPLALAPGRARRVHFHTSTPQEPGRYVVRLLSAEVPERLLASAAVELTPDREPSGEADG